MGKIRYLFSLLILTSFSLDASAIEAGDILLQPLKCWSCSLIEQQENSEFSHVGIYLGQDQVAEAYFDKVKIVSLAEFMKKTDPARFVLVRRLVVQPDEFEAKLRLEVDKLLGLTYDRWFLWDNDKIYCSELVYKVLAPIVELRDLSPKGMLFDVNPEHWDRYFRDQTPRGQLGISPEDFNLSSDFISVEKLEHVRY